MWFDNVTNLENKFNAFCRWGLLEDAKTVQSIQMYFLQTDHLTLGKTFDLAKAYYETCETGHLNVLKWLTNIAPYIINLEEQDEAFCIACENGHLEVAKWILSINPNINISVADEFAFRSTCEYGYLEVAQWLLSVKPDIDISFDSEYAFRWACEGGHLEVAQWLISIKPNIDISARDEWAFRLACMRGKLDIAKWLLSLKTDLTFSSKNHEAFRGSCYYNHIETALWVQTLDPTNYHLIIENEKIIYWEVFQSLTINDSMTYSFQDLTEEEKCCPICSENTVEVRTNCGHSYCKKCIQKWTLFKSGCPYCRQDIKHYFLIN